MGFEQLTDGQLVATIDAVLDALTDDRLRLPSDADQLELLKASLRVDGRLRAWQARLAAGVEGAEAAWREHGTSTVTWLADAANLTRREAARLVKGGQDLERFPVVAAAATRGEVLPAQAEAITAVLGNLPRDFPDEVATQAQELMVGFAGSHNSAELRRLTRHLLELLSPDTVEKSEADRLEREHRVAMRNRYLRFSYDHHGSVLFGGSLPVAEAEPFIRIIDAYAAVAKRGLDRLDPNTDHVTPAMNRADDDIWCRVSATKSRSLDEGRASGQRNRRAAGHGAPPRPASPGADQWW